MANELSISRNNPKPLTTYQHGVTFTVHTFSEKYRVTQKTAEHLSDILVHSLDTKFVRIQTESGIVTISTSDIKAVGVDETEAKRIIAHIQQTMRDTKAKTTKAAAYRQYYHQTVLTDLPRVNQAQFWYYYAIALKQLEGKE